ncbi:MAG: iron-containing alcohol dehydrogenase [Bdellovibrionales bacterium]|nr:iron-containing alcohol dehydrogenase [Ramlibacter sp.]
MSFHPFIQQTPAMKTIAREGAVDSLGAELALLRARRPLLVCSASVLRSPLYERVTKQLEGLAVLSAGAIPAHSSAELVEQLAAESARHQVDVIIAVGGGSCSDTAKAVALLMAEGGRLADHATRFTPPADLYAPLLLQPKLPIVTIPCTASGAEVTSSLGIRAADGSKLLFTDPQLASRVVLLDPQANLDVPVALMLSTGMNGLAHCVEGLYSKVRSPLAEVLAIDGIARFARVLPAVRRNPGDVVQRGELMLAAHLSGLVLVNARTCLHHAICHAIGSVTGVGHGDANAVMLPHALSFNFESVQPQLERAAVALGRGSDFIAGLRELAAELGVPTRLRDIGVPHESLTRIATKTLGERGLFFNPRTVRNADEMLALLEQAW